MVDQIGGYGRCLPPAGLGTFGDRPGGRWLGRAAHADGTRPALGESARPLWRRDRVLTAMSAGDAIEEVADRGKEAVLLFGEHHVRGVLEHHELGAGQPPRHVLRDADCACPVVAAGDHQHRMGHLAEPVLDVGPAVILGGKWRITSGAYRASPAARRRYSSSAGPCGSQKWNGS